MKNTIFSQDQVRHTAKLANLPLSDKQVEELATAFGETLDTIATLKEVDTSTVIPTHHVTGLENVTRVDEIDSSRILTQEEALSGGNQTHNGYFVVSALINNE